MATEAPFRRRKKRKKRDGVSLGQLKKQYRQDLKDDPTQEGSNKAWKKFLKEKRNLDGDKRILPIVMAPSFEVTMPHFHEYILGNLPPGTAKNILKNDIMEKYIADLLEDEIITTEDIPPQINGIISVLANETVDIIDEIGTVEYIIDRNDPDLTEEELEQLYFQDTVGYTAWFNILDTLHVALGLPPVNQLKQTLRIPEPAGADLLEQDCEMDFRKLPRSKPRQRRRA